MGVPKGITTEMSTMSIASPNASERMTGAQRWR
jgi:hypothetical protein